MRKYRWMFYGLIGLAGVCFLLGPVVAQPGPNFGRPGPSDVPSDATPEEIAQHCLEKAARIAHHCVQSNQDTAEMCVCRVLELVASGMDEEAVGLARRCAHRINEGSHRCVRTIMQLCHRCAMRVRAAGGDAALLERLRARCMELTEGVATSRADAAGDLQDALGDLADLEALPQDELAP